MGHDRHTIPPGPADRTPPPSAPTALLDEAVIDRLRGDFDLSVRRRLLDLFLGQAPGLLETLRARIAAGDADGLGQAAHRLKGSCLNLGARRMSELCGRLERLADARDLDAAAEALAELERAFAPTRDEFRSRLVGR